jgi:modification methylase
MTPPNRGCDLDPFFGSGTTGAVAKKLHRHWIGIEKDENYVRIANERIDGVVTDEKPELYWLDSEKRRKPRIPFGFLIETAVLKPGQALFYCEDRSRSAIIRADGKLQYDSISGSIHFVARFLAGGSPMNGWEVWFFEDESGTLQSINQLRLRIKENGLQ